MSFAHQGFAILDNFLPLELLARLREELQYLAPTCVGGMRNPERKFPIIKTLCDSPAVRSLVEKYLHPRAQFVRAILFDKTADNNWLVTWHQDKTICVASKKELAGWGPWSVKDGVQHVQPPQAILEHMVSLRIHLDDSTEATGALNIIPGSHNEGILSSERITQITHTQTAINAGGKAGSVLVMKPLLLHSSSKAISPTRRRVLHLEYCSATLPEGITWI